MIGSICLFFLLVALQEHFHTAVNKEQSEDNQHPLEARYDSSTNEDKDKAHHDSPKDTPVEHMLVFFFAYVHGSENHHHDKKIIYRESLLNKITRDVCYCHLLTI